MINHETAYKSKLRDIVAEYGKKDVIGNFCVEFDELPKWEQIELTALHYELYDRDIDNGFKTHTDNQKCEIYSAIFKYMLELNYNTEEKNQENFLAIPEKIINNIIDEGRKQIQEELNQETDNYLYENKWKI